MFLIAGVQPKTRRIDANPRRCPSCGLTTAYTTRVDHYLSLFFIPLIKVKQGEPFLLCEGCRRQVSSDQRYGFQEKASSTTAVCVACGESFDGAYNYCPYCGQRQK